MVGSVFLNIHSWMEAHGFMHVTMDKDSKPSFGPKAICMKPSCSTGNPVPIPKATLKKTTAASPMIFRNVDDCMDGRVDIKGIFGNAKNPYQMTNCVNVQASVTDKGNMGGMQGGYS